ncbi:MAG: hypothetical protein ACKVS8_06090 [Phycisphaerales bacterium]
MTTDRNQPAQLVRPHPASSVEARPHATRPSRVRGPVAMLTVVAALLAANLFLGALGVVGPNEARAEPNKTIEPPFNAGDQRKHMIDQLAQIHLKLAGIESKLDKGLSVKVTEMPPVRVSSMPKPE